MNAWSLSLVSLVLLAACGAGDRAKRELGPGDLAGAYRSAYRIGELVLTEAGTYSCLVRNGMSDGCGTVVGAGVSSGHWQLEDGEVRFSPADETKDVVVTFVDAYAVLAGGGLLLTIGEHEYPLERCKGSLLLLEHAAGLEDEPRPEAGPGGYAPTMANNDEVERRTKLALAAIKAALGTEDDEYGGTLFVSHHLEELAASYWQQRLGYAQPDPALVIGLLELRSHWGDEDDDGIDTFDFSLPGNVTDSVISVRFDETGQVDYITMES